MKILRIKEVSDMTGLSTASVYKQIRNQKFPKGIKLTQRATGWDLEKIEKWIKERIESEFEEEKSSPEKEDAK